MARFRLLGPVRYRTAAGWSGVRAAQPRAVLALLLVEAGRTVSVDRLVDELWGDRPPRTARNTVQGYVMRLRRAVGGPLLTRERGYELVIGDDDLDSAVFERLTAGSRTRAAPEALAEVERALTLWDGPALADVPPTPTVTAEAARLEQRRLAALEHRCRLQLRLGQHAEIVHDLASLVAEHPLREELRAGLMLALYRSGRRADALASYRQCHELMTAELGIEPGPDLRELHRAILADDPGLRSAEGAAAAAVPAQLPAAVPGFTGRRDHLRRLDSLLGAPGAEPGAVAVVAVTGPPGVGKTALVTHWAHRVRDRFPDGQLHLDLRGYASDPPGRPIDALTQFLIALGTPADQVPTDVDAAARLYRSRLAGRRVLVVLDNANHPDQVRPLLPGDPGCVVLVTSRDQLTGLVARDGALGHRLGVLAADEARTLLEGLLGPARDAEARHLDRLAELCGGLPLALRIAAANLTGNPHRPITAYLDRLAEDRLAHLAVDGDPQTTVRAAFDLSYAALTPAARRLFRLLGLVPGPDIDAGAAAALAGA
ncbi:AfsR/SARP family transcriptional regulator, partial [Actinoplanes octamycinicus]